MLVSTALAVVVPLTTHTAAPLESQIYNKTQVEYYMSDEEIGYIRPGYNIIVENVTINADNKVVVTLAFKDDKGQPLDRAGNITPGTCSASFILTWYDAQARQYTAYTTRSATSPITGVTATQAGTDSGGTWTDLEMGRATYTFKTALPSGYDATKTHTIAIYGGRNLTDIIGKQYYSNIEYDFRPDGQPVTETWNAVANATCNACHHDLGLHGGSRKNIKNCVQCHQPQTSDPDTGNTVDMKVMIHKIHMGANLPSVEAGTPYQIIGHNQSVHDYSEVVLPMDIRNCQACHKPDSPEGDIWMTRPNRAACASCHDDINWETGENHPLPQFNDDDCASCHVPQGDHEFDISVVGAHTIEVKSSQLEGLNMEIVDVTGAVPGGFPTVTFRVTDNAGTLIDPADLNRFSLLWGGPTVDYAEYYRESVSGATMSGDTYMYTLTTALPEDAAGTWTFSADVYRFVVIDNGTEDGYQVRECAFNPIYNVEVGASRAVKARREVVSLDKCNVCHDQLALHGGQRFAIEECVICHNPNESDESVRPEEELPVESVHFKWMIHRIHTGLELENDFTIYGHGGSENNYNHVGYPGDRRYCEACHEDGTYNVPLPEGVLPTPTPRDYYTPMQPAAAACLSCHSSVDAASHAYVNTAPFGEACAACHGEDRDHAVEKVHAR